MWKLKIAQLQLALFYDANTSIDLDGLSYFVRREVKRLANIDLGNNQMFGVLPPEVPPEVPRLQLSSTNSKLRVQCSLTRFDFFYERNDNEDEINFDLFIKIIDAFFNIHNDLLKPLIRVGLIAYKTAIDDNPSSSIARMTLNPLGVGNLDELSDVNLMFNKPFQFEGQHFNCHLTFMSGMDVVRGRSILVKQIDVSSLENLNFSNDYKNEVIKRAFILKTDEN
ncbi:hypothetical protein D3C72_319370 [compost metagenome]